MEAVKVYWKGVRDRLWPWAHVKVSLNGNIDVATCKVCSRSIDLPPETKTSDLRRFTRIHYYRHKVWTGQKGGSQC